MLLAVDIGNTNIVIGIFQQDKIEATWHFATDVHKASLEIASAGVYEEASLADVSPQRRKRYFTRKGNHYQVVPELRQMIVFAPHNVIKDAPFTRIDLISCRNLLIYFQPPGQKKAISLFHFALKTGGVLMLGGPVAYGRSGLAGTPVAKWLPVSFTDGAGSFEDIRGAAIKPTDASAPMGWQDIDFAARPGVKYIHRVKVKPGGKISRPCWMRCYGSSWAASQSHTSPPFCTPFPYARLSSVAHEMPTLYVIMPGQNSKSARHQSH